MTFQADNTRAQYWGYVKACADDAIQAIKDKEIETYDDLDTWIHETVDGSEWVIYTHQAELVMHHTDNENALFDAWGELPDVDHWSALVVPFAFFAMRQDLMGRLVWSMEHEHGWDINDEETWNQEVEDDE